MGAGVLLDACRTYGIRRFHQVFTDEVYGDLLREWKDLFFTESTPLHASSPYSSSEDGIQTTIQWYLEHKEWWQHILSGEYQKWIENISGGQR